MVFPERVSTEVRTFRSRSQSIVKIRNSYYSTVQCLDYRQYMFTSNMLEMSCEILELIDHNKPCGVEDMDMNRYLHLQIVQFSIGIRVLDREHEMSQKAYSL